MCGIVGFVGKGSAETLGLMRASILHRGPDDDGAWSGTIAGSPIRFGFRRLAIIDLTTGAQPMASADGKIVVVFNGEIYNHRALRRELEALGHAFRTDHADTEVLIHGYRQWGADLVGRLNGMFAFALADLDAGTVILARDPYGKKPLYYAATEGGLVFGSELRAVLLHPSVPNELDPRSVARYFAFDYVPAPDSLYRGVRKLPGGKVAVYDVSRSSLDIRTFWQFRIRPTERPSGGAEDWAGEVRRLLTEAVERRLESDVPLGFFLSGGVDSSAVVALARKIVGNRPIDTFSIGFNEATFDESAHARRVAEAFGTRHHEKILDLQKATEIVGALLRKVDEPVADDAIVPTYLLSSMAREHVTVALSGDGGDELFAGYDTFSVLGLASFYDSVVPRFLHPAIEGLLGSLPVSRKRLALDFKLRRALRGLGHGPGYWHTFWIGAASISEIGALCKTPTTVEALCADVDELWHGSASADLVDRASEYYVRYYLQDDIMAKVDRASMLCSLEVRAPFLDRELADFVMRLPPDAKIHKGERKWILKRALDGVVSRDILERKKQGFSVPMIDWLRRLPGPDLGLAEDIGLDAGWLAQAQADHLAGRADHRGLLWAWHSLEGSVKGNAEAVKLARQDLPEAAR